MSLDPKRAYREAAVRSATPVRLILMLYEAGIEDLRRIIAAIQENDIQRRTDEAHHFLQVLNQLQGSLDMERGGDVAANLDRYYSLVRSQLWQAELNNSSEIVQSLLAHFLSLHQAWLEVERATTAAAPKQPAEPPVPSPTTHTTTPPPVSEPSVPENEWSA